MSASTHPYSPFPWQVESRALGSHASAPPATLAPDRLGRPYQAIKAMLGQLVPGTSAVVIGVGGLGHMALQLLKP